MKSYVKGLGEVAISVTDLETAVAFYRDKLGLELIRYEPSHAFFKLAEGAGGHTQVIALFKMDQAASPERTRLHHLALEIEAEDFETVLQEMTERGLKPWTDHHEWVQWSSIYLKDPDGNVVEFVCMDPGNRFNA